MSASDRGIDLSTARGLAEARLREIEELFEDDPVELVIDDSRTTEIDLGWIFFWDTAEAVASGDDHIGFDGNSPIVVTHEGFATQGASAHPVEDYVQIWRRVFTKRPGKGAASS